jgi:hypothetical protein
MLISLTSIVGEWIKMDRISKILSSGMWRHQLCISCIECKEVTYTHYDTPGPNATLRSPAKFEEYTLTNLYIFNYPNTPKTKIKTLEEIFTKSASNWAIRAGSTLLYIKRQRSTSHCFILIATHFFKIRQHTRLPTSTSFNKMLNVLKRLYLNFYYICSKDFCVKTPTLNP